MESRTRLCACVLAALLAWGWPTALRAAAAHPVLVEVRLVDSASGVEAVWGTGGQVLIPPLKVSSEPSRQSLRLEAEGRAQIRVGRGIPFAGWFLRQVVTCGLLPGDTSWSEVESLLGVELLSVGEGAVRLGLTPQFGYTEGRDRRSVAVAERRAEVLLPPGEVVLLSVPQQQEQFFGRFLSGYDPRRGVRPLVLALRAAVAPAP